MRLRRLFWLGAAVLFSVAALVGIAAVLRGHFDTTQWRVMATCAIAFITGSTALAGLACIERGVLRPAGVGGIVLGRASFAVWTAGVWSDAGTGGAHWKLAAVVATWTVVSLIVTTLRLLAGPRTPRLLVPATGDDRSDGDPAHGNDPRRRPGPV